MDKEYINMQMEHNFRENGLMICKMELVLNNGQMALFIKVNIKMGKNMVRVY